MRAGIAVYLTCSIANARLGVILKKKERANCFLRCILSTAIGEGLDAIFIGFFSIMPLEAPLLMIAAQALFKTIWGIVAYPLAR